MRRQSDAAQDFSWVKRWAAVGDSYTAAIGAGNLWSHRKDDVECSRYDRGYPILVNNFLGPSVKNFQYPACSGARSVHIIDQINGLQGDLDLVMMTAGGNDLCLSGIITSCIVIPRGEGACNNVLQHAQNNIDNILKPNIRALLDALNPKMKKNSIVVLNLYAEFFNAETDDCEKNQDWRLYPFPSKIPLTKERRRTFNTLAVKANKALQQVVEEFQTKPNINFKIGWSDWGSWAKEDVNGLMCAPESKGNYPDPNQPELHFFKPQTYHPLANYDLEHKRDLEQLAEEVEAWNVSSRDIYGSALWKEPNPGAEVLRKLDRRAPDHPNCPGDGGLLSKIPVSDGLGKFFHPNELGHHTMASFALAEVMAIRGKILGVDNPLCRAPPRFTCFSSIGSRGYASADRMDANYQDFCDHKTSGPPNTEGWTARHTYHPKTPDEHEFVIHLSGAAKTIDKVECRNAFKRIIHGCDGNNPENPLNWKFGGSYVQGLFTYELHVKRKNRPWPMIKEKTGKCGKTWKLALESYTMRGRGWSGHDFGQDTLLKAARKCVGGGITSWKFWYHDPPEKDGTEWSASFNTPVGVHPRCFNNNKVQFASGGFTNGCHGM